MARKRVVLLDVDGTLIDSNDAHAKAWVETASEFGHDVAYEKVRRMIGMGGDKVLPELTGLQEESEEGKKILDRRGELFRKKYLPGLKAFPHARELLTQLKKDGYALVVATSASEEDLNALLEQGGLDDIIEKATSSDDAEESKPAPDIVEAALKKARASPNEAYMIGDTPYDVAAARRAGVEIIGVECGGWPVESLRGAVAVYKDPADLFTRYSESVFGKK